MNRVPMFRVEVWQRRDRSSGFRSAVLAMVGTLALLCVLCASAQAAEGERVLEPRLSLIGGCKAESLDNVEDPGCPSNPPVGPHPPSTFSDTRAVATDDYGNIYVGSFGSNSEGSKGRIDVFCSDGTFVSELGTSGPTALAIDSDGNLYVFSTSQHKVLRFAPDPPYDAEACEIEYGGTAPVTVREDGSFYSGLAINRDNDHLFGDFGSQGVVEYGSAGEGTPEIRVTKGPEWGGGAGMAVDAARDRMYANAGPTEERIDIFDLTSVTSQDEYEVIGSILPSSTPAGDFGTQVSIAIDEGTGNVFVLDGENCALYEFEEDGTYLQTIHTAFVQCTTGMQIGVDNGPTSPNGKVSEEADEGRYLYVPSNRTGTGHSYAFFISTVAPPEVHSIAAANISEDEAELRAEIDPNNLESTYTFELKAEGAAGWTAVGGGTLPTGNSVADASAPATGLSPGTNYRFRVIATNEKGSDEAEGSFATYPNVPTEPEPCANALLRTGPSALLPDCRAYELVTPADTNARAPHGPPFLQGVFTTRLVSPAGDEVPFRVEGGALPGLGGTGALNGDPYLATRTDAGWSTAYTGPPAGEATSVVPGGTSPDQGYSFYRTGDRGAMALSPNTGYVRYPDGHSELIGQGSLGKIDPEALGQWISEGGGHIIFATGVIASVAQPVQLEPDAAPDGTPAVYDRTLDGTTHVVSLKPGDVPFGDGEDAIFKGASFDGVGIAFEVGSTLYLRYDDEETFTVSTGAAFAGIAEGGRRVFYVQGGNLKAFDIDAGILNFTTSGNVTPVTVATGGTTAFFVSESAIAGSGPNPEGDSPHAGEQNLYRSVEGQIDFVATVTERDVEGSLTGRKDDGLGLWVAALAGPPPQGVLGLVPARSAPDGSAFLFKSRAALTDYDPEGKAEIYRYAAGKLQCLSCNPTGAAATSDATLQTELRGDALHLTPLAWPENLRPDGRRAFFETSEALVAGDSDGLQDVYEWEDQGVGSCRQPEGCVYLVSSPRSRRGEYLWAVSRSGEDVFFLSSDLLVGSDADETPSIYDARVGGGFPETVQGECEGEGCRPNQQPPPIQPTLLTPVLGSGDNVKPRSCPKGKRKVKRAGKVRCVKKKHHRKHAKHRAGAKKKGGRR